jgi:uronate dehydrogenase
MLDADSVQRPDTYYGVSKAFGEDLGSLYVDKYDLEIACLRIGSCTPMPREPRHLSTWLSYPDLFRLVSACLDAPKLEFTVMYGASKNARTWWDNAKNPHVKYEPQDNAEDYAAQILSHGDPRDPKSPEARFHGGPYCADGYVVR